MSKSIRISPKHGVNPTIPVCFFCGQPKNEIALMGKVGKGSEDIAMPMYTCIDYEPCDTCKSGMNQGIALIEVTTKQPFDKRPPISKQGGDVLYPTGSWCVIKEDAAKRIFGVTDKDPIMQKRKTFVEVGVLEKLGVTNSTE